MNLQDILNVVMPQRNNQCPTCGKGQEQISVAQQTPLPVPFSGEKRPCLGPMAGELNACLMLFNGALGDLETPERMHFVIDALRQASNKLNQVMTTLGGNNGYHGEPFGRESQYIILTDKKAIVQWLIDAVQNILKLDDMGYDGADVLVKSLMDCQVTIEKLFMAPADPISLPARAMREDKDNKQMYNPKISAEEHRYETPDGKKMSADEAKKQFKAQAIITDNQLGEFIVGGEVLAVGIQDPQSRKMFGPRLKVIWSQDGKNYEATGPIGRFKTVLKQTEYDKIRSIVQRGKK